MATPTLMSPNMFILGLSVLFGGVAYVFYLYLSSVWLLGLVVSVVGEESCGIEALGKSAKIIKGQKVNGFLLNIVLNLVSLGVYLGSKMITSEKICGLFLVNCSCLVKILTFVAYTVLYFWAKESHGQEIELNLSNVEYGKLPTTPFVNDVA
ncbi:hypothetical protein BUALT_Bualt12G0073100 [Buddleja alternifolia]|uniref:Uncharacterized protein n=1 Tax=Buddleja alternifolia TaxID=168488 RepID=A0AAV6WZS9_9LAMI|nr:hypothetical protein BUALT_Bualt12G0073100 [Buddleja alternifolia]